MTTRNAWPFGPDGPRSVPDSPPRANPGTPAESLYNGILMAPGDVWVGETRPSPEAIAKFYGPADTLASGTPRREPTSIMMPAGSIDYALIDPGVRNLVRWLNEKGYATTDSGDGVTKPADGDEGAETHPHVYIQTSRAQLLDTADRLKSDLASVGVHVDQMGPDMSSPSIQATYDPGNVSSAIMLYGVSDATLQEAESMAVFESMRPLRARANAAVMGDDEP